jgi:hypothetical protein
MSNTNRYQAFQDRIDAIPRTPRTGGAIADVHGWFVAYVITDAGEIEWIGMHTKRFSEGATDPSAERFLAEEFEARGWHLPSPLDDDTDDDEAIEDDD